MKTELIDLKLADWSRTVGMAMIERRATVQELIESAVSHVGDDLLRIAVAHAEQKNGLTYGKNKRAGDDREHMEWHAKCGCAYHPEPFPHVHPCSDAHKRPDLHADTQAPQAPDLMKELRDRLPECPSCCERSTFPAGELCGRCRAVPQSGQAPQADEPIARVLDVDGETSRVLDRELPAGTPLYAKQEAPQSGGKDADALLRDAERWQALRVLACLPFDQLPEVMRNSDPKTPEEADAIIDAYLGQSKTGEGGE